MTVLYSLSLVPQGDCSKNYKKEYTTLNNKEKFGSIKTILTFPSIWNVPIYFFHNASMLTKIIWKNSINSKNPIILDIQQLKIHRAFSDEIIAAILLYQVSPVGIELFTLVNTLFCSNKFALYMWLNVI